MNRNVKTVLAVSILFGAATGIYEFVLPYYLKERGFPYESMGRIFTVAAAGMLALRIIMGRLADTRGRKLFYGLSLGSSALAMWLTPSSISLLGQSLLKTIREAAFVTRETLHPVVLYEESRGRFMAFMGRTRGLEYLFQGVGTLACGYLFLLLGTGGNLRLAGAMLALAFLFFWLLFRERQRDPDPHPGRLRDLFTFEMHPNLRVIALSSFVFNVGLTISHSFIMPLFFSDKFGVSESTVAWVMVWHRLTIAFPLLIAGSLRIRNLKAVYIATLALEGLVLSASALIPNFYGASAVWLLHDLIGAGIWIPVQNMIIQEYTRPAHRALELGKIQAFGGVGTIFGPFIAGYLSARVNVSAPFFASGLLMVGAAAILALLRVAEAEAVVATPAALVDMEEA